MTYTKPSNQAKALDGYVPFPDERTAEYVEAGYWRNQKFHDVVDKHANRIGDAVAVIDHRRELTYAELNDRSRRLGAFFRQELGIEPLDRVLFQLPNRAEFLEALLACSRVGAVPVMLLPRHRRAEFKHVASVTDARAVITIDSSASNGFDFVGMTEAVSADLSKLDYRLAVVDGEDTLPNGWQEFDETIDQTPLLEADETPAVNPCDPALFLLSGGTTGLPKAIPRTHNDYVFQWQMMADEMEIKSDWTGFASVPAAHNASLVAVIGPALYRGATVALEPRLKPESLMNLIERTDGNWSLPIPTQLIDILSHPEREDYDLSSLKLLISGGQKVPPKIVTEAVEEWGIEFGNVFGMAEGPIIVTRPGDDVRLQAETVGYPIAPEVNEVRLVDTTNRNNVVNQGEKGELCVRGPGCFTGYFRNPEENNENFDEEGWFYTEDVLRERDDGYYEVHGRLKDMIIRGGENIYTPGLEDELVEHPRITNVAVVGKPDDRLGERPFAYVELAADTDELMTVTEVSSWLAERGVAVFKHPEFIEVVDELPRTEVQKIDKQTLRERVRE